MTTESQRASVLNCLKTSVTMTLCRSGNAQLNDEFENEPFNRIVLTISRLLHFHASTAENGNVPLRRRTTNRERPVSLHLAMKLYGETRMRVLVDVTYQMSILYHRPQTILSNSKKEECLRLEE